MHRLPDQSAARLRSPFGADELGLGEDGFGSFFLQVWRVAVFSKNSFHQTLILAHADSRNVQSMVTLLRTRVTSSISMTFSSSLPMASTALSRLDCSIVCVAREAGAHRFSLEGEQRLHQRVAEHCHQARDGDRIAECPYSGAEDLRLLQ